jgi:hypothetical protein
MNSREKTKASVDLEPGNQGGYAKALLAEQMYVVKCPTLFLGNSSF